MKIIICDDDQDIISKIIKLLNTITEKRKLAFDITSYSCGEEAIIDNIKYDVAFVDIEMLGVNGLTVTKHLQNSNPNIIVFIVTSFQAYLDDAMALNIFRYLSKPIDDNRFLKNMCIAIDIYQKSTQSIITETYEECFNLFTRDILYVTIENRKACLVTKNGNLVTKNSFDFWKKKLQNYDYFVQSHYSFIVNLKNVTHFSKSDISISKNKAENISVPISRRFYSSFKKSFYDYIGRLV